MKMAGITDGAFCFKNHNRSWCALLSLQVASNAMWLVLRRDFMMCHNISKMLWWQRCDNLTGFARHMSHQLFLADVERLHPVKEMPMWWFQEIGHHWEKHNCWQYGTAVTCQSWWGLQPRQPLWRCSPPRPCKYVIRCITIYDISYMKHYIFWHI